MPTGTPTGSGLLRRSLAISLIVLAAFAATAWFGGRAWLSQSVMPYQGQVGLSGLSGPVEVLFDQRGIPRIYAGTDADALRALGWLHAGERLLQMELIRRMTRGKLAELVGEAALPLDVRHRAFGFYRRVIEDPPALEPETAHLIDAYLGGINSSLQRDHPLPPGMVLLGARPQPWTRADVLAIAYYQTFYPTTLVQRLSESWRAVTETFGESAGQWLAELPDWTVPTLPESAMTRASNTWVVAPERSASGAALHASDPHLDIDIAPGLWYAAGLHVDESLDVIGVTVPGLPFVAMGHNGHSAWAFTVAPVDVFELYRQARLSDQPMQLQGPHGPQTLLERRERFLVRGRDEAVERTLYYTPLGPVIELTDQAALVLRWAGFELPVGELIHSGLSLNRATDFASFRQAATAMGALSVNWSYSDRQGNIGYVQSTPVPVRRHRRFFTVLDAGDPATDWDGFYPPEARPFAFNPPEGWLANANNHAAGENWPFPIPGYYKHLRMRRISALLGQDALFDREDMTAFQLSQLSDRALSWKDWLADVAATSGRTAIAAELRAWDGEMSADSDMGGLFALWWNYLPQALFKQRSEIDWRQLRPLLDHWLHDDSERKPLAGLNRDQAALTALEDALKVGIHPLGRVQQLTIRHPLALNPLIDRWLGLTRGPLPVGGDAGSLNVAYVGFDPDAGRLTMRAGASMRYVMDWADVDRFSLNLTLGQSGNPFSPHFDDFLNDWRSGRPWTVPWGRATVEARAQSRLEFRPQ